MLGLTGALMVTVGLWLRIPHTTDFLVKSGFAVILVAILGYIAQTWLLSEVAILGYMVPVWQLLVGLGIVLLLVTAFAPKKFRLKLPKVKWR